MDERIISARRLADEATQDTSLRPKLLAEYIGQERVKQNLGICLAAAKARGESLDHVLLYGPPGLGKTTLAHVIANEMGVSIKVTSGPAIVLYPAMEDYALDIVIGKGPSARSIRLKLPHFTIIGATTRIAMMTSPLRDRFGIVYRLDFYDEPAMEAIVGRSSRILGIPIDGEGVSTVARRARGTPRVANRLLKRVRDFAQVRAEGVVTAAVAQQALGLLEVDALGLDDIDRKILQAIIDKFDGGPVGLETIAASLSEEADTIMDVCEPYLLQLGFLERTPRGRVATARAYEHLGRTCPQRPSAQPLLL